MILNMTKESIKELSGRDLALMINIVCLNLEDEEAILTDEWTELLGALTEEYHDRYINGGDLEGYDEALIKLD